MHYCDKYGIKILLNSFIRFRFAESNCWGESGKIYIGSPVLQKGEWIIRYDLEKDIKEHLTCHEHIDNMNCEYDSFDNFMNGSGVINIEVLDEIQLKNLIIETRRGDMFL